MKPLRQLLGGGADASEIALPQGFTHRQLAASVSPRIQELILLPTEKCNFRCTYCYEDFLLGKMSEELQRAIELFLDRRVPELKKLSFSWFGGEPLVAKDVVLRLSRYANALCQQHGVAFHGGLTTNAYVLDKELAKALLECRQNFFQITLDGWREAHDVLRQRADGQGTFEVIWNNLKGLQQLPYHFECVVRVHVRRDNLENLETLMVEFARTFRGDPRFRLDFQHLRDMGGEGGKTIINGIKLAELPVIRARLLKICRNTLAEMHGVSLPPEAVAPSTDAVPNPAAATGVNDSAGLAPASATVLHTEHNAEAGESAGSRRAEDLVEGEPFICYAAKPNSILIRANGRIGKCTVAFDDERNDLGYLRPDGTLAINNAKLQPWIRGLGLLDSKVTGCPMHGMAKENLPSPIDPTGRAKRVVRITPI